MLQRPFWLWDGEWEGNRGAQKQDHKLGGVMSGTRVSPRNPCAHTLTPDVT